MSTGNRPAVPVGHAGAFESQTEGTPSFTDIATEAPESRRAALAPIDKRLFGIVCAASFVFGIAGGIAGGAAMGAATSSGSQAFASQPGGMGGAGTDGPDGAGNAEAGASDGMDGAPSDDGGAMDSDLAIDGAPSGDDGQSATGNSSSQEDSDAVVGSGVGDAASIAVSAIEAELKA